MTYLLPTRAGDFFAKIFDSNALRFYDSLVVTLHPKLYKAAREESGANPQAELWEAAAGFAESSSSPFNFPD
jgi:hypothetical protein